MMPNLVLDQNHSCQTALVNIIDKWIEERNNGNVNVVILLDLKKAFDIVDHDIMARKLEIYGFNEKAFAVFNSYMTNRTQQEQIGNALSNKCPVNHGVLQAQYLAHYCLFYI